MVISQKTGLQNDSYTWPSCATLRFHLASETEPECLKTYAKLCSEWYDIPNSFSKSVRYCDALLSGLRLAVNEPIVTNCSGYFSYVYNDNVNAP